MMAQRLLALPVLAALAFGCSDDGSKTDAGNTPDTGATDAGNTPDTGATDAGSTPDTGTPDTGPTPDAGNNTRDAGPVDAGHHCAPGNVVTSAGTSVPVGGTSARATLASGNASLDCLGEDPPGRLVGGMYLRVCLDFLGAPLTAAQVGTDLEVAIFQGVDQDGNPVDVDPTRTAAGQDRMAAQRVEVTADISDSPDCPSRVQLEIGRGEPKLRTDLPYVVRVGAKDPASTEWVDSYLFGAVIFTENLEFGSGAGGNCRSDVCRGFLSLTAVREAWLKDQIARTGALVGGSQDLNDQAGDGYVFARVADCKDQALLHATGGFVPTPAHAGYVADDGTVGNGTDTSRHGLYAGLGVTGTSSTAPAEVAVGAGVSTDGTCTEAYGLGNVRVYPDAISVQHLGRATTVR